MYKLDLKLTQRRIPSVIYKPLTHVFFVKNSGWKIMRVHLTIAGFQCHAIQNKNQNHSIDKVQILRKERR